MKYYAVTEDPNELFHYGVKGMKWGQHLFGKDLRPKSAAYKRAASKLRSSMKSGARSVSSAARAAKNTIQKGAMQIAYNNRARQDRKYQKAVLKAQRSTSLTQALSNLDKENRFKKQVDLDRKREAIADKLTSIKDYNDYKSMKKSVKAEKKMPKYLQEAREGTLKYGKLSEEQIGRVQDRLALEASTRRLGSTEAPKFKTRMKMAVQEGLLQGTTRGIATGMEEVAKAKVQNKMKNRRQLDKQSRIKAEREHEAQRIKNDRSHAEIREDLRNEAYEANVKAGKGALARNLTQLRVSSAAKSLEKRKLEDREQNERLEEAHRLRVMENNDAYNDQRQEQQFLKAAKSAYEYGYVPSYLNGGKSISKQDNGDDKNKGGKQNKDGGKSVGNIEDISKYYESRMIKGETIQDVERKQRLAAEQAAKEMKIGQRRLDREMDKRNKEIKKRQAIEDRKAAEAEKQRLAESDRAEKERYRQNMAKLAEEARRKEGIDAAIGYGERQAAREQGAVTDSWNRRNLPSGKSAIADANAAAYRRRQEEREMREATSYESKRMKEEREASSARAAREADNRRRNEERAQRISARETEREKANRILLGPPNSSRLPDFYQNKKRKNNRYNSGYYDTWR